MFEAAANIMMTNKGMSASEALDHAYQMLQTREIDGKETPQIISTMFDTETDTSMMVNITTGETFYLPSKISRMMEAPRNRLSQQANKERAAQTERDKKAKEAKKKGYELFETVKEGAKGTVTTQPPEVETPSVTHDKLKSAPGLTEKEINTEMERQYGTNWKKKVEEDKKIRTKPAIPDEGIPEGAGENEPPKKKEYPNALNLSPQQIDQLIEAYKDELDKNGVPKEQVPQLVEKFKQRYNIQ